MSTTATSATALRTGHVGLNASDLDRSVDVYGSVLGLEVQGRGDAPSRRWASLGRDGKLLVTLWQQSEGRFATALPGLHHLCFQVPHADGQASGGISFADPDGIPGVCPC